MQRSTADRRPHWRSRWRAREVCWPLLAHLVRHRRDPEAKRLPLAVARPERLHLAVSERDTALEFRQLRRAVARPRVL
eukprot:5590403-Prymnesium_polylepis.1